MMKMWRYKSEKNPEVGFTIQEQNEMKYSRKLSELVKTGKKVYTIWHDPYEGGTAYDTDWNDVNQDNYPNVPDLGEWKSFDEAYKWVVDNYGEITEIEDD